MITKLNNKEKKTLLRQILLSSTSISRNDLAKQSGLNLRTVHSYAEELENQGLIESASLPNGKGRPAVIYNTKINSFVFMGVLLMKDCFYYQLIDANKCPLYTKKIKFDIAKETSAQVIAGFIKEIKSTLEAFPEYVLAGVNIALSEYMLSDRVRNMSHELLNKANNIIGAHITLCYAPEAILYSLSRQQHEINNIAAINPTDELRVRLMIDGKLIHDVEKLTYNLRHLPVAPDAPLCYCGNRGCLGNLVTQGGTLERYKAQTDQDVTIQEFRNLVSGGNPVAVQLAEENGRMLAQGIEYILEHYQIEKVYLNFTNNTTVQSARNEYYKRQNKFNLAIEGMWFSVNSVVAGSAEVALGQLMSRYYTAHQ
jgi:hypothetical protein